jgi:hypothetical protein
MEQNNLSKQLEESCIQFYKTANTEERTLLDQALTNFIKIENYESIKSLLGESTNPYVRFYAANSLITLYTQNFITISSQEAYSVYEDLLNYLVILFNLSSLLVRTYILIQSSYSINLLL